MAGRARPGVVAVLLAIALLTLVPLAAGAQGARSKPVAVVWIVGKVTALNTQNGNPTGFVLRTVDDEIVSMRIAPRATFTARSAEAEVEGLHVGDYAIVRARNLRSGWVALHIAFDVQPIRIPNPAPIIARVVRETPNNRFLVVRLSSGVTRWVMLDAGTRFRVDGIPAAVAPAFVRGELVHLILRQRPHGWTAVEVDLGEGVPAQPR